MNRRVVLLACALTGCATAHVAGGRGRLITPSNQEAEAAWTEDEKQAPLVLRNLRSTPEASTHVMRVKTQRDARVHSQSDLSLFIVAGELELTVEGKPFRLERGDVLEVPRGTPYAIRNLGGEAGVAYLEFTPALADGDDKSAAPAPKDSAWRWNLWVQ